MYVIKFTKDLPKGFAPVTVDLHSDCLADCLSIITSRYISNNYPELILGEDSYEAKGAIGKDWLSNEYVLDRYNCADFTFTVEEADYL